MPSRTDISSILLISACLGVSACATPRIYTEQQLSDVARACGAAEGEVVQEEEQPRLLFLYTIGPPADQRRCLQRWANRRHLRLVYIDAIDFKAN